MSPCCIKLGRMERLTIRSGMRRICIERPFSRTTIVMGSSPRSTELATARVELIESARWCGHPSSASPRLFLQAMTEFNERGGLLVRRADHLKRLKGCYGNDW